MSTIFLLLQDVLLLVSTLLCTTCFGFVLIFAIVIMPGLAKLENGPFLHAFKVIDGVIQNSQPIFVVVWLGSILSLVVLALTTILSWLIMGSDDDLSRTEVLLILIATVSYLTGQYTTFTINIPLNNRIQSLNIDLTDDLSRSLERDHFETRWNVANEIRTVLFGVASLLLLITLVFHDPSSSSFSNPLSWFGVW